MNKFKINKIISNKKIILKKMYIKSLKNYNQVKFNKKLVKKFGLKLINKLFFILKQKNIKIIPDNLFKI